MISFGPKCSCTPGGMLCEVPFPLDSRLADMFKSLLKIPDVQVVTCFERFDQEIFTCPVVTIQYKRLA